MIAGVIHKLKEAGVHKTVDVDVAKKARLVNMVCLLWGSFVIIFIILDTFVHNDVLPFTPIPQLTHTLALVGIGGSFWANHKQRYQLAKLILIFNTLSQIVLFSYILQPGSMIELNLCLIPSVSMLFLKDRRWHIFLLVLCVSLFIIPNAILFPDGPAFRFPITKMTLFIGFFLLVSYFLKLNEKNENNLARQKAKIEELYKFKNRFFINVAHEIRTPLTILSGNLNRLNDKVSHTPEGKVMEQQILKIKKIVDDVLDLSKMDTGTFTMREEPIQVQGFIQKVYTSFHSNFQNKNIDYQLINYLDSNVALFADKVFLERALNNIIHNAYKYTPEHGIVHLILDHDEQGGIYIKVKDNGIGIAPEEQEKIFDQFYQINNDINSSGGSGVGLAFSKEVITKLGGSLKVHSESGKGSEFMMRFNQKSIVSAEADEHVLIQPVSNEIPSSSTTNKDTYSSKKNVLIVEDHDEMREYIKSILTNYEVMEASNGKQALDLLARQHVDLIITDYMMPVMDGLAFVTALKEKKHLQPVIVLTARSDQAAKMDMLQLGVDDYVTKPFEEKELCVRISNRLQNAGERNEELKATPALESSATPKLITAISDYISIHCHDSQLSVESVCEAFNLSSSSLYRKVKGVTGLSPKNLITEIRLLKVREMIETNPSISRKELALSVGWGNTTYLSKMYESRFGKRL